MPVEIGITSRPKPVIDDVTELESVAILTNYRLFSTQSVITLFFEAMFRFLILVSQSGSRLYEIRNTDFRTFDDICFFSNLPLTFVRGFSSADGYNSVVDFYISLKVVFRFALLPIFQNEEPSRF